RSPASAHRPLRSPRLLQEPSPLAPRPHASGGGALRSRGPALRERLRRHPDHRGLGPPGFSGPRLAARSLRPPGSSAMDAAARGWLEMPLLLFHDLHVGMALAAAGDWSAAETQLDRLRERGKKSRHPTLPEVVVPLMEGLHAFAREDYHDAVAKIAPIDERIIEVGGSHAQRE